MSFEALKAAAVARRTKDVSIKMPDGSELQFKATEISYLDRVSIGLASAADGEINTRLIVLSITDQDGKHMSLEQARALSDEHQEVFYRAALDVNRDESKGKDKKKVKPDGN